MTAALGGVISHDAAVKSTLARELGSLPPPQRTSKYNFEKVTAPLWASDLSAVSGTLALSSSI